MGVDSTRTVSDRDLLIWLGVEWLVGIVGMLGLPLVVALVLGVR